MLVKLTLEEGDLWVLRHFWPWTSIILQTIPASNSIEELTFGLKDQIGDIHYGVERHDELLQRWQSLKLIRIRIVVNAAKPGLPLEITWRSAENLLPSASAKGVRVVLTNEIEDLYKL